MNKKISEYDPLSAPASGDTLFVLDSEDTSFAPTGTPKRMTVGNLMGSPRPIGDDVPSSISAASLKITTGAYDGATITTDAIGNLSFTDFKIRRNDIGIPGSYGFGIGICPDESLPSGIVTLAGYDDPVHANYGNYIHTATGSIVCWIPKFYYRIAHASNPTYPVHLLNSIDVKSIYDFASEALANASGYALHRAFVDGGAIQDGFFIDKHTNSSVTYGSGTAPASISLGNPISTHAVHNPIASLTAGALYGNIYGNALHVAKARDGVNGAINTSSNWHCMSIFQHSALALLSLAHGQASSSAAACAWYSTTVNFPKGNNNNALKDTDDTTVVFQSDGYTTGGANSAKVGSGFPFAKTTHNGQNCGVADLNGNMWNVAIGLTAIVSTKTITGATQANPCEITSVGHGLATGRVILITAVVGMTQLNDKMYTITVGADPDKFTLNGVDSSAYTTYGSAGTISYGIYYAAKESTAMKTFTASTTTATDHWGATGVAALMEEVSPVFNTVGGASISQRFGSSTNQVFSGDTTRANNAYKLTALGFPMTANSVDTTGTNLFGKDYFYQYFRDQLCPLVGGYWTLSTNAGVFNLTLGNARAYSNFSVGFRLACYSV